MANQLEDAPTKTEEEQSMTSWTSSEKENSKSIYGCDILIENGTLEQVSTKDCPNDAMIVTYIVDGKERYDLTRSQKEVRIFDMYYDKFKYNLKGIDFGMGRTNPKLWGIEPTSTKKKK
tara:strand:+ start:444 stop:800 length:357 start_codon:yes stop_codon:yes gene_type:complete